MSTNPFLNKDPELLKTKTQDDEVKDLKYKVEKHDHEKIIKSATVVGEHYKIN